MAPIVLRILPLVSLLPALALTQSTNSDWKYSHWGWKCKNDLKPPITKNCDANESIPVPLPFDCPNLNLTAKCVKGKRVDLKAVSDAIQIGGVETRCSPTIKANMSINQSYSLRIEMIQEENVYAVFILEKYKPFKVRVRNYFDNRWIMSDCFDLGENDVTRFVQFFCYWNEFPSRNVENLDLNANAIEVYLDPNSLIDVCQLLIDIQIYSYPYAVCNTPVAYSYQNLNPNWQYYLAGQTVIYNCNGSDSLVGDSSRTCQQNGTWSGTPPTCVTSRYPTFFSRWNNKTKEYGPWEKYGTINNEQRYIELKMKSSLIFDFERLYDLSNLWITFNHGDKKDVRVEIGNDGRPPEYTNMTMAGYNVYQKRPRTNIYVIPNNTSRLIGTRIVQVFGSLKQGDDAIYEISLEGTPILNVCDDIIVNADRKLSSSFSGVKSSSWSCHQGYYDPTTILNATFNSSSDLRCDRGRWIGNIPNCTKMNCTHSRIHSINTLFPVANWDDKMRIPNLTYTCPEGWHLEGGDENQTSLTVVCRSQEEWDRMRVVCVPFDQGASYLVYASVAGGILLFIILCAASICIILKWKSVGKRNPSVRNADPVFIYENVKDQSYISSEEPTYANMLNYRS